MNHREVKFTCPKCSGSTIEEIMVEVIVASEIRISTEEADETGPGGIFSNYGEQTNEDGHVDRYQCGNCGFTIVSHDPAFEEFTEDGVDVGALAKVIDRLNAFPAAEAVKKGDLVSHDDLVTRIAHQYATLSGQELADEWNRLFPEQVVYKGDSLFSVEE